MYPIELIIFDCDGVLVDSEHLSSLIIAELLSKAGYSITPQEVSEKYAGLIMMDILKRLEKQTDIYFSLNLVAELHKQFAARMGTELNLIHGVKEAIANLELPHCICSNASTENLTNMLELFDLMQPFKNCLFSAQDVGTKKLKPDPNVFLFAAEKFNIKPAHCLVIEDSIHGLAAAKAANMRSVGFTGGSHTYPGHANALADAGAETVYADHSELNLVINALRNWKDN
ncbi:MAG: HAD family phosphatase [Alphaproteobacteria bacterium]|nr:HAD family phosphatase [Alphaproteobacteria bacterium]